MIKNNDALHNANVAKYWTYSAIECYSLGCNCNKCNIHKMYFLNSVYKCKMKFTVLKLIKDYGKPLFSTKENL